MICEWSEMLFYFFDLVKQISYLLLTFKMNSFMLPVWDFFLSKSMMFGKQNFQRLYSTLKFVPAINSIKLVIRLPLPNGVWAFENNVFTEK